MFRRFLSVEGNFRFRLRVGTIPAWRRDGKELYYLDLAQKLMAVPVKPTGASFLNSARHRRCSLPLQPQTLPSLTMGSGFS